MATEKEIDEIKTKVHIYDIISSYITLKRSGSNYFGLCPFHNEKSPSFSVNDDLGYFKCFGCQESGDVITFIQKIDACTFGEAIEKLADIAGITLSHTFTQEKSQKKRILEMNTLAQEVFSYLLLRHKSGEKARQYLKERHISQDSVKEFKLGYDYYNTIVQILKKRGFTDQEIINYGLGVVRNGILVDKYRHRLIFPILSITGEIVGFSGRIIEKNDKIPKYINSPETELFKKNAILYGLYNAKQYVKKQENVILLEGPIDVISAFQTGIKNVCAVQGTSLTPQHLYVIKRLTESISFCFDQDNAGLKALRRSFGIALEAGISPKVINITHAKDVDEKVNTDKKGFLEDINNGLDIVEYLINKDLETFNISTLDGKLKLIQDILPLIQPIRDTIKKNYYMDKLAEAVQVDAIEIRKMVSARNEEFKKNVIKNIEKNIQSGNSRLEYLLALFLQHYKRLGKKINTFDASIVDDLHMRSLIIKIQEYIKEGKDIKHLVTNLDPDDRDLCMNLLTIHLKTLKGEDTEYVIEEVKDIEKLLQKKKTIRDINELKNKLWVYEQEQDDTNIAQTMEKIALLTQKLEN